MALHRLSAPFAGFAFHVVREGAGARACLLLHGFTESASSMLEPARPLEEARIAIELPGHGASEAPAGASFSFDATVGALDALLVQLQLEQVDLWGYSMGGRLALALALRRPERIRRLVLESTSAGLEPHESAPERLEKDRQLAQRMVARGLEAFVDEWERLPLFASERELPAEVRARIRAMRLAHRPAALADALVALSPGAQQPLWGELHRLCVPTLVLSGARDEKYQRLASELASRLPLARRATIEGAGHAPHRERPEATIAAIRSFLAAPEVHP